MVETFKPLHSGQLAHILSTKRHVGMRREINAKEARWQRTKGSMVYGPALARKHLAEDLGHHCASALHCQAAPAAKGGSSQLQQVQRSISFRRF